MFLHLYSVVKLSAADFCILCHLCAKAGVKGGAFSVYAQGPDRPSGQYQRHLDSVLPGPGPLYWVPIPMQQKRSNRAVRDVPFRAGFECLRREVESTPALLQTLDSDPADRKQNVLDVPIYKSHPLVQKALAARERAPLPVAIYLDSVRYTSMIAGRSDSILGLWLVNLLSSKRHVLGVLRHQDFCRCGCHGWCTIFPALRAVAWMVESLQNGRSPIQRHDHTPWSETDDLAELRNFGFSAVLLWVKGDWGEHAKTLGLAPWSTLFNPCQFCEDPRCEMHERYDEIGHVISWPLRTHELYEHACLQCERSVVINTEAERRMVVGALRWLKGKDGQGRTLVESVMGLEAGGRLEPSEHLLDIAAVDTAGLPLQLVFWYVRAGLGGHSLDSVAHRCPLFSTVLETSPQRTLAVDSLHTLYYGPMMRWTSAALWRTLLSNPWGCTGSLSACLELGTRRLTQELAAWFDAHATPHNRRIREITVNMLGDKRGCTLTNTRHPGGHLKTKAAETGIMHEFAMDLIVQHGGVERFGRDFVCAGDAMLQFMRIMQSEGPVVSENGQRMMLDCCRRHLLCCGLAGVAYAPKHHLFAHMCLRISWELLWMRMISVGWLGARAESMKRVAGWAEGIRVGGLGVGGRAPGWESAACVFWDGERINRRAGCLSCELL